MPHMWSESRTLTLEPAPGLESAVAVMRNVRAHGEMCLTQTAEFALHTVVASASPCLTDQLRQRDEILGPERAATGRHRHEHIRRGRVGPRRR